MQNANEFIKADQADEIKLGINFAKGFAALLLSMLLAANPHHKAMASAAEHQAVLNLVPVNEANRQVAQSGNWSNLATWGGNLPSAGDDIYVPQGKTLVVDVASDIGFGTVRVDGIIKFATSLNVRLKLDTLVVTPTGSFEVGSEYARVPSTRKVEIVIANNGPIDRKWDPTNISRGVILQGKTRIYGSNKSAYHEIAVDPAAGSTQITLANTPVGWVKGDIIAVTATKFRRKMATDTSYQTEDELRRIKAIVGNTITLGSVANSDIVEPLQYSHVPTIANMPVYVANLTRNVVFSGEGGDAVPASQRGHFMVMHAPNTIIKGAGFYHLGRTNKAIPLDDFALENTDENTSIRARLTDTQGNYIKGPSNNPRGRYAVHFHHTGIDPSVPPVICSGNAVISSPGWGFVNHTSNVIMQNNASYNVLGSHFVTEDGNELGIFKHNIAIKSSGRADTNQLSGIKTGLGNHDHGHSAHGFWFQGRNIQVEDNVVSGTYGAGVAFYNRSMVKGINLEIPKDHLLTQDKSITKDLATINFHDVPIVHAKNITVVSSWLAVTVIRANNDQGHDARSVLESIKGYSLLSGIVFEYLNKHTLKDIELVADDASTQWNIGINVSKNNRDLLLVNAKLDGFVHPIVTGTEFNGLPDQTDMAFINVQVNGSPMQPEVDINKFWGQVISNYDPAFHLVLQSLPAANALSFAPSFSDSPSINIPANLKGIIVAGNKIDSLGQKGFTSRWREVSIATNLKKGYYTRPDGSKFIILSESVTDRLTGQPMTINTKANIVTHFSFLGPHLGMLPS